MCKKNLVLVTGATGSVGPGLVRELMGAGYSVRTVVRPNSSINVLPHGTDNRVGDILNRQFLDSAMSDVKIVFHLAAKLHIPNPMKKLQSEYWRVNVDGTRNVVAASEAAGVKRLIYFSTINVYGGTNGLAIDETFIPFPQDIYSETKYAAEQIVLSAQGGESGIPMGVVLRMSAIYGSRMKGNYPRMVRAIARGRFVPIGSGANRRTMIHEEDAIRAALIAAESLVAAGEIFNVSDGTFHTLWDIYSAICVALERPVSGWFLPVRPIRFVARIADALSFVAKRQMHLTSAIDKLVEDVAVGADKIQTQLGFCPLIDLHQGWTKTLASWTSALPSK